jgi:uncharacterized membrane protein
MLTQLSLNKDLSSCVPILISIPRKLSKRRVEPDLDCQPSRHHDSTGGKRDMSTPRKFRNFWLPWVTTIILACASDAVAQTGYKVTDLGTLGNDNMSCAMTLNDQGWTAIQDGNAAPGQQDAIGTLLNGRDAIVLNGVQVDLGTLGGKNSFMNWGEINDWGQIVGYSETDALDPNGEDICGFGTHLTCRPFLWQDFHMKALPTLGGNNGQASAINNRGQIVGFAEDGTVDSSCPPNATNNRIQLPVLWENGKAHALPTVGSDPDGVAYWINDLGQAVGQTANCSQTIRHAVSWTRDAASALLDYGTGATAWGNNDRGQIVGTVGSADGKTQSGALWQNDTLTVLGLLPGDFGGIASGINDKDRVTGFPETFCEFEPLGSGCDSAADRPGLRAQFNRSPASEFFDFPRDQEHGAGRNRRFLFSARSSMNMREVVMTGVTIHPSSRPNI